jgi:hypothetical protein
MALLDLNAAKLRQGWIDLGRFNIDRAKGAAAKKGRPSSRKAAFL